MFAQIFQILVTVAAAAAQTASDDASAQIGNAPNNGQTSASQLAEPAQSQDAEDESWMSSLGKNNWWIVAATSCVIICSGCVLTCLVVKSRRILMKAPLGQQEHSKAEEFLSKEEFAKIGGPLAEVDPFKLFEYAEASEELSKQLRALATAMIPDSVRGANSQVFITYADGHRWQDGSHDAKDCGPEACYAAGVLKFLYDNGVKCFSHLMLPENTHAESFAAGLNPRFTTCKVLLVIQTKSLYESKRALQEIYCAQESNILLVPLRFDAELPPLDQVWPQITREDLDGMLWVSKVQANFCKLNSIPSPPYTIVQQPNVLNDVLADLRHALNLAGQATSVGQRLMSLVSGHGGTRKSNAVGRSSQPLVSGLPPADRKDLESVTLLNPDFADAPSVKLIKSDTQNRLSLIDMPKDLQEERNMSGSQSLPIPQRTLSRGISSNSPDGSESGCASGSPSYTKSLSVKKVQPRRSEPFSAVESAPLQPVARLQKNRRHKKTVTSKSVRDKSPSGALMLPTHSSKGSRKHRAEEHSHPARSPRERKHPAPIVPFSEQRSVGKHVSPSDLPDAEAKTATKALLKLTDIEAPDSPKSPKRPPRGSPRSPRGALSPKPADNRPESGRNFECIKSVESVPSPKTPKTKKKRGKIEYV